MNSLLFVHEITDGKKIKNWTPPNPLKTKMVHFFQKCHFRFVSALSGDMCFSFLHFYSYYKIPIRTQHVTSGSLWWRLRAAVARSATREQGGCWAL